MASTLPTEQLLGPMFLFLMQGDIVSLWAGLLTSRDWKHKVISRRDIQTGLTHLIQFGNSGQFLVIGVT